MPKHLSPRQKAAAKRKARRAGRPYPSLVDNMAVAAKRKSKSKSRSKARRKPAGKTAAATRKKVSKRSVVRNRSGRREEDPRGGLTAAGRKSFARKEGAHLRPGVTKKLADMTPDDMRRKGSWPVRFYGRKPLPPLVDRNGRPTRFALSAHAWGEPVPKTEAAARRIAAKGHRLLERYRVTRAKRGRN
jgi:hypothetical protein